MYGASPKFPFRNSGSVTTTSPMGIDVESAYPSSKKYGAMDNVKIANNSSSQIKVEINGDTANPLYIDAGTIEIYDTANIPAFRTAHIYTTSGTATANQITVTAWRGAMTQDKLVDIQFRELQTKKRLRLLPYG